MARFSSLSALYGRIRSARKRASSMRFGTNRIEEVNNYSGQMTRIFVTLSARFAERGLDPVQNGPVPDFIAGPVQMDTVQGVMFRHGRQRKRPAILNYAS
jgi:hypothetical protein